MWAGSKLVAQLALLGSLWLALSGCSGGFGQAGPSESATPGKIKRVKFSPRRAGGLGVGDRLDLYDRVGFSAPSAVLYDEKHDVYWVSNVNSDGPPKSGFISRVDPTARVSTLNFIDAARPGVTLDAPHGLALRGDVLFVADVTAIRSFDAENGDPLGSIEIPGARYLSDVAVAADGSLYVTDVGSDPNLAALPESDDDAVYQIAPGGEISVVARRTDLGGPAALLADEKGLWVACAGTGELLLLVPPASGAPTADAGRLALPAGGLRGIAAMPDGTLLISSWAAGAVYRGLRDGPFEAVVSGLESPADLDYDTRRKRLLIPLFTGHALAIFELPPLPSTAPVAR